MHRSRLTTVVIDCAEADYEKGAAFWSAALGRPLVDRDERFSSVRGRLGGEGAPYLGFQRVPSVERAIHLDIETDDVEAEVARLEALGAKKVAYVKRWWVMEAPTGQRFCVLKPQRGSLDTDANDWP